MPRELIQVEKVQRTIPINKNLTRQNIARLVKAFKILNPNVTSANYLDDCLNRRVAKLKYVTTSNEIIPIEESNIPKRIKNVTSMLETLKQLHPHVAQMKMREWKLEIMEDEERKNSLETFLQSQKN